MHFMYLNVISIEPPWKEGNALFTMVPLKPLTKYKFDINDYNLEN